MVQDKAKNYSNIKYSLSIFGIIYNLVLFFLFLSFGFSNKLALWFYSSVNSSLASVLYLVSFFILYYIFILPLNFYQSYVLERKFSLTNQSLKDWIGDQIKGLLVSCVIGGILIAAFYLILKSFPDKWWLIVSAFWIFFSVVLAKVMPVVIIPLFFKYKKLEDGSLRRRIMGLADKMKVKLLDCYEIDFSKKTLKGNAAFVGVGNTKRVIIADTLRGRYTEDEILVILAHEFAHYQLKHLLKLITVNSAATVAVFYLIFKTHVYVLGLFGLSSLSEIAAFPVILLYLTLFGIVTQPLESFISRRFERSADLLALKTTGLKNSFISMMNKLGEQNLADRSPNPVIKFFFFDHPPIDERIKSAELF